MAIKDVTPEEPVEVEVTSLSTEVVTDNKKKKKEKEVWSKAKIYLALIAGLLAFLTMRFVLYKGEAEGPDITRQMVYGLYAKPDQAADKLRLLDMQELGVQLENIKGKIPPSTGRGCDMYGGQVNSYRKHKMHEECVRQVKEKGGKLR